jgi:hypothetical protein
MPHALVNTRAIWDAEERYAVDGAHVQPGTNLCSLINESNDTPAPGIASIHMRAIMHCINKTAKIILMYYDLLLLFVYHATATPSTVINRSANGK